MQGKKPVDREEKNDSKLREAELRYYTVFEQSPYGMLLIDTAGNMREFNEAAHIQLGYSREEFAKLRISDIDPFQSPGEIQSSMRAVLEAGNAEFEVKHRTKGGDIRDVRVITKVMNLSGRLFFQTIWHDITEQKRAEEELRKYREHLEELVERRTAELLKVNEQLQQDIAERARVERALMESEKRYRMLFEGAGDAIFILDAEGNKAGQIVAANRSAALMHGYTVSELLALNIADLDTPDEAKEAAERINRMLTGEWIKAEITHRKKDGTVFPVEISAGLLELGNHKYILAFDRDVTERKRMEGELIKTRKLESISFLAGGLAHDFNNLLTGIMANISLAKKSLDPGDETLNILNTAGNACHQAKDLTYQLFRFAKGGQPERREMSVASLIMDAVSFSLKSPRIKCEFSLPGDLWHVEVDEALMDQVIHNLVINACEAMPDGGLITISGRNVTLHKKDNLPLPDGKYIRISVKDEGTGIPQEHLEKIFDPYFTTKKMNRSKGTGLVLAVCYSLIKKHDGYITVESEVGRGTTFHIYLAACTTD